MSGWIKLHRAICKWSWYDSPNCVHVFVDLLVHANHKETSYRGVSIPAGSLTTSQVKIAQRTGLTTRQVRTVLDKLSLTGEVSVKSNNKFSMISITNWDIYQQEVSQQDSQTVPPMSTSKKLRNKEVKNNTQAELVIEYFNATLKKSLGFTPSNFKEINARLKEGHTVDQMKTLIDHVSEVWTKDPFWSTLIRPSTMFGGKFDGYLQEVTKVSPTPIKDFFTNALKDMEQ